MALSRRAGQASEPIRSMKWQGLGLGVGDLQAIRVSAVFLAVES